MCALTPGREMALNQGDRQVLEGRKALWGRDQREEQEQQVGQARVLSRRGR